MYAPKYSIILTSMALILTFVVLLLPANVRASLCTTDTQCDDGLFCNGLELCLPDDPLAGPDGCVSGRVNEPPGANDGFTGPMVDGICRSDNDPYTHDYCDEREDLCRHEGEDVDGDGHASIRAGGDDCNDRDADIYPGNVERCDPAGKNEDCDLTTVGRKDSDGDGYTDSACYNTGPDGKRIYDLTRH